MDCMSEPVLSGGLLEETYKAIEEGDKPFFRLLDRLLKVYCDSGSSKKRTTKKRKSEEIDLKDELVDDSDILMPSDDLDQDQDQENAEAPGTRSAKKRKKTVLQSQEAQTQQIDDRIRIVEQELRRSAALQKMKDMVDNADGDLDEAALHHVSFDPVAPIYLDPHIGKKVKPHQEGGIQFMWRELTAGKGCMLAHTMGLGKTMQVISLLITIAQASASENVDIQNQVPPGLRTSRTLILSPPTLIDNWYEEILMWTPEGSLVLGEVRKIVAATDGDTRMYNIEHWALDGGVLLMTYPLFKSVVDKTGKKIPDDLKQKYANLLTHKANIVVADEAHHMKNPASGLAKAAMKLTTKTRIALTGSPLSNHLEEYHQMVDWISPGYLGSIVQFKAKYSEPIKNGLYSDSSSYERKISARKLLVLKRDLDPKICRADISAIAKDMPNKAEFFITIPLTEVQKGAYSAYAKHMLRDHAGGSLKQAKLWSWLSVLSLLLNHPSAFVKKLEEKNEVESESPAEEREPSVDTEDFALPDDVPLSSVGLTAEATKEILSAFSTMTWKELHDVQHSYRSVLTTRIVKESMRIKEKVLIFSHSIPTLDYLERLLEKLHCNYSRIDGRTSMPTRQGMVRDFNNGDDIEVMLISTNAGGLGLNLQGANRVILYDFNFNPTWEEQAVGRAYRLGQKKHVFVYRFRAGGTFEETIYNMAIFKTQLFARVVDKRNPMRYASKNLSDYLFPPREVEQAELDDCLGKDPEVLDRIMEDETCIRKVEFTETFQVEEDDELTPEELKQAEQEYQDEVLARTDPDELKRLMRERDQILRRTMPQYGQAQLRRADPASATRPSTSQRPTAAQASQLASARILGTPTPHVQFGAYDDMELSPLRDLPPGPRGRANSVPRRPPQMDGTEDKSMGCRQQ
jgi:SNF2 family DNA or RNA helicase